MDMNEEKNKNEDVNPIDDMSAAEKKNIVEDINSTVEMYKEEENSSANEREQTDEGQPTQTNVSMNKKELGRRGSIFKGVISTVAAGVIGSALTLAVAPHTDYFKDLYSSGSKVESASQDVNNSSNSTVQVQKTSTSSSSSIADTVEKASKAVVGIVNIQDQQSNFNFNSDSQSGGDVESGTGSGVIFKKKDGMALIVTNNHVIEGAKKIQVSLYNGKKVTGKLIGADALTDLAVVEIDAKNVTNVLDFGDSSTLRPGDQVLAIGNPLGLDFSRSVTQGIVSATNRTVAVSTSAGDWDLNVIQTDAAINPGNSGGALINTSGQVMGINSMKIAESGVEGLGFAIPSNDLVPIINEIIEKGKVERPYLGVALTSLDEVPQTYLQSLDKSIKSGAIITQIDPDSAAAKAGLEVEDIILSIDGHKIENTNDLREYLYSKIKIGDTIKLEVYHNGKTKTVNVKLSGNSI
ncbi:S1C family serine protease [Cytobacillus sp. Hz8]|uniref:S1C family serine protease n=1 Tax=Cytobacillus sp. Hz8 TaxID=3347168 RepID=UPI0035D5D3D4